MTDSSDPTAVTGAAAFAYRSDQLHCEDLPLAGLAARYGTPLYVYSDATLTARYQRLRAAFGQAARICFAVKSNSNLSLLRRFHDLGAGFDLVSGGELQRLQAAGIDPSTAVFAGVAKETWEIEGALAAGIQLFNLESPHELELLAAAGAKAGVRVPVALRLNPDVDAGTHAFLSTGRDDNKFGIDLASAGPVVERIAADPHLELRGYHVHLGSQLRSIEPYLLAFDRVAAFMAGAAVRRQGVSHYDLGGGFGVGYGEGPGLDIEALAQALLPRLEALALQPILEPGRFLIAEAGVLLCTVLGRKERGQTRFLLVDAAMNDLLRPALYDAHHPMLPVQRSDHGTEVVDVVGPVCESGDFLAKARELPVLQRGDLLAVAAAGAYGAAMASNYNTRRRPAEVLVSGNRVRLLRRRESFERLWADEVDL
jgi:diaminopimelate decarboxylase